MSCIAIITARGGSKRIPRKNIKEFCGKPIIAYSIEAALESGIFSEVMVSTDDAEIAEIAKSYGAKVPFLRSEATSNDYATTREVLAEVLEQYRTKLGKAFKYVCCLYPTAPFVTSSKLKEAFTLIQEEEVDQVVPVVKFSFPPQRCYVIDGMKELYYKWPEYKNTRSQDLEPFYHDAGQFYFYKSYLLQGGVSTKIKEIIKACIVSELEVQDIDNQEDWDIAEIKYQLMQRRK